jgi:pSer/pThr/pTyr-binding forkhead associated (FHA) protein
MEAIKRMSKITFQVIDGVDKGRIFRDLSTPVTIGREEGNTLRLNDERVSRFHAKVQQDQDDLILTDLESTNGTRVNSNLVQIHRLRFGDFVSIGRTTLLYGSYEEIAARQADLNRETQGTVRASAEQSLSLPAMQRTLVQSPSDGSSSDAELDFDVKDPVQITKAGLYIGKREFPPLPLQLSPSQAARLAEIFDCLHRALSQTTDLIQANPDGTQITLDYPTWQKILAVSMLLARYHRAVTEPDSWQHD